MGAPIRFELNEVFWSILFSMLSPLIAATFSDFSQNVESFTRQEGMFSPDSVVNSFDPSFYSEE